MCYFEWGIYKDIWFNESPSPFTKIHCRQVFIQEIAYQTYVHGIHVVLLRKNKTPSHRLPICVGSYQIENVNQSRKEQEILISFHFG